MATNTWQGDTDALWDTDANWDLGHKPTILEDVVITSISGGGSKLATGPALAASCATLTITTAGAEITLDLTNLTVSGNCTLDVATDWDLLLTCTGTLTAGSIVSGTFVNASSGCIIKGAAATFSGTATDCTITGGTFVNITNTALQTLNNNDADLTVSGDITLSGAVTHVIQDVGVKTFVIPNTVDIILVGDTTKCCMKNALDNGGTFSTTSGATQLITDTATVAAAANRIMAPTSILGVVGTRAGGGILRIK